MKTALLTACAAIICSSVSAQINYGGGTYTQDFNTLRDDAIYVNYTNMPNGWVVSQGSYVWTTGAIGYSANYGTYCFASAAGAADKSLGLVVGSTGAASFGAQFRNASGMTLNSITISYYEEQWIRGAVFSTDQVVPFQYSIGANSLTSGSYVNFSSLDMHSIQDGNGTFANLDGNTASNRQLISGTISGISWSPNQSLWIRWSGVPFDARHGMAVDDLSFAAVPEPGPGLLILCAFVAHIFRRKALS